MGEVYLATDSLLEREVAVKVLSERYAGDASIRRRFMREALAAARLSGRPHVVMVFDVGEHQERPFIVMAYMRGGSVDERLRSGPPPLAQSLDWLEQAGIALDGAHAAGIVHRDVKPANLLLDAGDVVHVGDFGIARAAGLDSLTNPGTVLGTAGYLSPEQAAGMSAGPASDRYALGVVAFELLTGRRPFAADTAATEAFAHAHTPPPSAHELQPALPDGLDGVFAQALAKDPDARPRTCAELVDALRRAVWESESPTVVRAPPPAPASQPLETPSTMALRRRRRRRFAIVAATAAVVAAGGAATAALLSLGGDGAKPPAKVAAPPPRTDTVTRTVTTTTAAPRAAPHAAPANNRDDRTASQLNDAGYAQLRAGDAAGALPLLERAVSALAGTGSITEAYASYNLAWARFALGRCDGVAGLLDRSQEVQGHRKEIDRLRKQVDKRCGGGGHGGGGGEQDKG